MSKPGDPRSTRRWKELTKVIIARDGVCSVCGTDENLSVDHIIPISMGGAVWDEENLVTMCKPHNTQKSDNTIGQVNDYINKRWRDWEAVQLNNKESKA